MRRLGLTVVVLLALAAPASAYEHLSQHAAVSGVQADHWATLPINLTVDGGPTDLLGEIQTAVDTWNAVPRRATRSCGPSHGRRPTSTRRTSARRGGT
jgi:hypothetical protein